MSFHGVRSALTHNKISSNFGFDLKLITLKQHYGGNKSDCAELSFGILKLEASLYFIKSYSAARETKTLKQVGKELEYIGIIYIGKILGIDV